MAFTLRKIKGSILTHDEADANFMTVHPVARTLLSQAIMAMNNNVRTRRVMDFAPAVVVTTTKPAEYTLERRANAAGNRFFIAGGQPVPVGANVEVRSITPTGSTQLQHYFRFIFRADARRICFEASGGGTATDGFRVIVDGQYLSLDGVVSSAGAIRYYSIDFGTHASRTIQIEGSVGQSFGAVHLEADGEIFHAFDERQLKMIFVGDSNVATDGIDLEGESYGAVLADHLGVRDVAISGLSSSGFVSTWGGNTYYARRQDWESVESDLLIFQLSVNDLRFLGTRDGAVGPAQIAEIYAAIMQCYTTARAADPERIIVFVGIHSWVYAWVPGDIAAIAAFEEQLAADFAAMTDPNVTFVRSIARWSSGDAPIGSGREGRYVAGNDHMNIAGNRFYGQYLARKVVESIALMYGMPAPSYLEPMEAPRLFHIGPTAPSDTRLVWIDTSGT